MSLLMHECKKNKFLKLAIVTQSAIIQIQQLLTNFLVGNKNKGKSRIKSITGTIHVMSTLITKCHLKKMDQRLQKLLGGIMTSF